MHQLEDILWATSLAPLQQMVEAPASAVGSQVFSGATDATLKLDGRQFADAANTLRLPKAGARRPVVFAFNNDELRIVVKWDGATFWSRAPAALIASEPIAFKLPYEHFAHAARRWMKAGDLACLRYSSADRLLEFTDHTHKPRPSSEHFFCVSAEEAKPDWNDIWADLWRFQQAFPHSTGADPRRGGYSQLGLLRRRTATHRQAAAPRVGFTAAASTQASVGGVPTQSTSRQHRISPVQSPRLHTPRGGHARFGHLPSDAENCVWRGLGAQARADQRQN